MTQVEEQGNRLNIYLRHKNHSKRHFADKIGIHPTMISMVTNGKHEITNKIVQGLIQFYPELNLDWVFHGRGEMLNANLPGSFDNEDIPSKSLESEVMALKKEMRRISAIVDKKKRP
jgi:hypothetical protein